MSNLDLSWSFSWTEITAIVYYIVTIIKDVAAYFETTFNFITEMEVDSSFSWSSFKLRVFIASVRLLAIEECSSKF